MSTYQDWLVRNSLRKYPFADTASHISDNGTPLPEGFLVDANIWVPNYVYAGGTLKYLYLSSAAVSGDVVSLTILGAMTMYAPAEEFVPIAVLSLPLPIDDYRNYPIEPLLEGVRGWVSFGPATRTSRFSLGFSSPEQTVFVPKAVRYFSNLPVERFTTVNGFSDAVGDVRLVPIAPMVGEIKTMLVEGEPTRTLVLSLTEDADTLREFAGPCGGTPESQTCNKTPIASISGVTPDCAGNITIDFQGLTVRAFSGGGGLCIDSPINLVDTCGQSDELPDENGILPGEIVWERPCDLAVPYVADFDTYDVLNDLVPDGGSSFYNIADKTIVLSAGGDDFSMAGPCFQSVNLADEDTLYRCHELGYAAPASGSNPGVVLMDTINTRIVVESSYVTDPESEETTSTSRVFKYNKGL
jgi:hypothetical protein